MPKIFISYRRDDNPAAAARVRDGLAHKFSKSNLFMDVDNLIAGLRFDEELAKALTACDVFIAIIGERWLDLMRTKAEASQPDYVRAEIAAALQRKIAVIPVRVGREGQLPRLPDRNELPPEIRDLVSYQKHDVTHEYHGRDIAALIEAIGAVRRHLQPERKGTRWFWMAGGMATTLALGYAGVAQFGAPVPWLRDVAPPSPIRTTVDGVVDSAKADRDFKLNADAEVEAKRKADEVLRARAAVADSNNQRSAAPTGIIQPPVNPVFDARAATIRIQEGLSRAGCFNGSPTGTWGPLTQRAAIRFNEASRQTIATNRATPEAVVILDGIFSRICAPECQPPQIASNGTCVIKQCPNGQTPQANGQCLSAAQAPLPGSSIPSNVLWELTQDIGHLVYFGAQSAELTSAAQKQLTAQAAWFKRHPQYKIVIIGHDDNQRPPEQSITLGEKRALAVKGFLVSQGIEATRFSTVSYGQERPQSNCNDDDCWSKNRRAEAVPRQ